MLNIKNLIFNWNCENCNNALWETGKLSAESAGDVSFGGAATGGWSVEVGWRVATVEGSGGRRGD